MSRKTKNFLFKTSRGPISRDASVEALSGLPSFSIERQAKIMEIINSLLGSHRHTVSATISAALADTGRLLGTDRASVFRIRDTNRFENTHEWVAPGVQSVFDQQLDLPVALLGKWHRKLEAGQVFEIPDVGALPDDLALKELLLFQGVKSLLVLPMMRDGKLIGFNGYDIVCKHRQFLVVEIQLLQSVANTISILIDRAEAEGQAKSAIVSSQVEKDRLQALLSVLPDLILECDCSGRFVAINSGADISTRLLIEQYLGYLPEEFLSPFLAKFIRNIFESADRRDQIEEHEFQSEVDGELRWFSVRAVLKSQNDEHCGYVLVIRDITSRRKTKSENLRLGKVAELTSNLVVVTDAAGRIEWVNPAFVERTGWQLDEVRGKKPGSFLQPPSADKATIQRISSALHAQKSVQAELLNCSKSGEEFWISKDIQPLFDETGQLEAFVSVQTDITELKRSHKHALRDRILAIELSSDGIAIFDSDGRYSYMNKAQRRMFGISASENVNLLFWKNFLVPESLEQLAANEWPKFLALGSWRGELVGRSRDGVLVQLEMSLTLKADGGVVSITRDISERMRKSLEQALLRDELQRANRRATVANVAASVAHDLNNIVSVVSATAGMLESKWSKNVEVLKPLSNITAAMQVAKKLVHSLSGLGRSQPAHCFHDIHSLVIQGKNLVGVDRVERHAITVSLPEETQKIWADSTEFLQVVINLLLNACEAGDDITNLVRLNVIDGREFFPERVSDLGYYRPEQTYAVFQVADTGQGVDASVKELIFQRYFSTKNADGSGIGLTIVADILEASCAVLWFDSTLGQGTTVTVAWPKTKPIALALPEPQKQYSGCIDLSGLNILVVDDCTNTVDSLADVLEWAGAIVVAVSDPLEAKELLAKNRGVWSVLVSDLHMPSFNGVQLAGVACKMNPPVPVVLVTSELKFEMGSKNLFQSVLRKPVDSAKLVDAVWFAYKSKYHQVK